MAHTKSRVLWSVLVGSIVVAAGGFLASCVGNDEFRTLSTTRSAEMDRRAEQLRSAQLVLIYSASSRNNFEPCGCGGQYEGGLSRRATVFEEFRKINPNLVALDAGDLIAGASPSPTVALDHLGQAYHELGYDAILVGPEELTTGFGEVRRIGEKQSLPFVLSNVKPKDGPGVPEVVRIERAGRKIAVIGVVGASHFESSPHLKRRRAEMVVEDPASAVARLTAALRPASDLIILLSHIPASERDGLAGKLGGVDVWIDNPGFLSFSDKKRAESQPAKPFEGIAPQAVLATSSWENDRKIGLACLSFPLTGPKLASSEMFELAKDIRENPRMLEIYDSYKFSSRQVLIPRLIPAGSRESRKDFAYTSSASCQGCHPAQYELWAKTDHAHAFATLVKECRDDDPACWACHSTGFTEASGFVSPAETPELKDVGCQMCHRVDLRWHPMQKPKRPRAYNMVQTWHCSRCHIEHRSPKYRGNENEYREKIACPAMDRPQATTTQPAGGPKTVSP
ncbi:MAG: hypothetical protein GXY33_08930 [Phycisphaerae bacterium]|nr:hypothetical protein [Phycisphaerae bacterium]